MTTATNNVLIILKCYSGVMWHVLTVAMVCGPAENEKNFWAINESKNLFNIAVSMLTTSKEVYCRCFQRQFTSGQDTCCGYNICQFPGNPNRRYTPKNLPNKFLILPKDMTEEPAVRTLCEEIKVLYSNETLPYFGRFFIQFSTVYLEIHKFLAVLIIIFGLVTNVLLLHVLSRKKMASPSNTFLIGISLSDTTVLIIYLFTWIPLISFNQMSYDWNFWFVALFTPYCIFR